MAGGDKLRGVGAVLFDLDGTLLDSLPGIAFSAEEAFAKCGLAMGEVELRRSHWTADTGDPFAHG